MPLKLNIFGNKNKENSSKTAYHVVSKNPLIIISVWNFWINNKVRRQFIDCLKGKKVYFIFFSWWTVEYLPIIYLLKRVINNHRKKYPKHNFIFLCNSKKERKIFKNFKIPSIFCNQNALLDKKIFKIMPDEKKKFDAIYNAQMAWFKRHKLASKINNLALISYFDGINSSKNYYNKTININLPLLKYDLIKGNLILELQAK